MGITVVTPPAVEPITLDEALSQAKITADTEDGLIAGFMIAARTFAENVLGRPLIKRTYDFTLDYCWPLIRTPATYGGWYYRTRIELPRTPVLGVSFVQYVDGDGNTQTLDASQYAVSMNQVVPFIEPAYNVDWPTPRFQPEAITVRFDAGYGSGPGDIPENIRQAMLMMVAFLYDNRGNAEVQIPSVVTTLLSCDQAARIL